MPAASRNTPSVASESHIRKLQHSVHSETPGAESPVQPDAHSSRRSASCSACVMAVRLGSRSGCTLRADAAQHSTGTTRLAAVNGADQPIPAGAVQVSANFLDLRI